MAGAFTEKRIQALRPRVTRIVDDLIDTMLAGPRPADPSHTFSLMVPASVICVLLGVPIADISRFHEWSNVIFGDWSRSREAAGDDLISVLVDARDTAGKLTEDELVKFCIGLLAAGHETTANSINMSFVALCQNPDEVPLPDDLVRDAAAFCPVEAILLTDADTGKSVPLDD